MNKQELIKLYDKILRDVKETETNPKLKADEYWNRLYKKLKKEVGEKRLQPKDWKLNKQVDYDFLHDLLYEEYHAVAKPGKGRLGAENFNNLIIDDNFLSCLKNLIMETCPSKIEHAIVAVKSEKLLDAVFDVCGINKRLVVNRVIAACTEDVSSTAANKRFDEIFNYLVGRGKMIEPESRKFTEITYTITDWYNKNVYLMEQVRRIIKEETNKEPDPTYSSMLIWYAYEEINGNRRRCLA